MVKFIIVVPSSPNFPCSQLRLVLAVLLEPLYPPLAAAITLGVSCHRGRATMAAMGSLPCLAHSSTPLVIPFIVLALLQLCDAHRLHSFTSTAQVMAER